MKPISFAIGEETSGAILTLFDNAKENIYLSTPQLDFNVLLKSPVDDKKQLFYNVIQKTCERGVNVHILVGEEFLRSTKTRAPPSRCFVRYVNRFGPKIKEETVLWNIDHLVGEKLTDGTIISLGDKSIFIHNQRYLVIDDTIAMIGSFDLSLHPNLSGAFAEQKVKYFPVSALVQPNEEFLTFIKLNWNTMGISTMPMQNRFFFGGRYEPKYIVNNPEHSVMIKTILEAKKSIYLQTQYFSSHQDTFNTVANAIATRLSKAYQEGKKDPFRCVILTNVDCSQDFRNFYCTRQPYLTVDYMLEIFRKSGVSDPLCFKNENRFFMGSVSSQHEMCYFQGTLLIQDEEMALITSSSVQDYSLGPRRCSELGILIQDGEKNHLVKNLFHQLLQTHLCLLDYKGEMSETQSLEKYIQLCYENKGRVKRFTLCSNSMLSRYKWGDWMKRKLFGEIV
jgi:hypothetical protein